MTCHTSVMYVVGKTFSDMSCHLMQYLQSECTHHSNHGLELCSRYWFRSVLYFLFSCFSAGIHLSDRAMWCYYFWPTHGWEMGLGSLVALPRLINSKIYPTKMGIMDIWHQTDMRCTMHQTKRSYSLNASIKILFWAKSLAALSARNHATYLTKSVMFTGQCFCFLAQLVLLSSAHGHRDCPPFNHMTKCTSKPMYHKTLSPPRPPHPLFFLEGGRGSNS